MSYYSHSWYFYKSGFNKPLVDYAAKTGDVIFYISYSKEDMIIKKDWLKKANHKVISYIEDHSDLNIGDVFFDMGSLIRK